MSLSKKKKNILIAITTLLFFGTVFLSLKYPLMSETEAESSRIAQENTVKDSKGDSKKDDATKIDKVVDKQNDKDQDKEEPSLEDKVSESKSITAKLDTETSAVNSSSNTESNNKTASSKSSGNTSSSSNTSSTTPTKPAPKPAPAPQPQPEPAPKPAPALKAFNVPASNSFSSVSQSTDPGRAELGIVLDSSRDDYETQLSELYNVIASAVGSQIATEAVNYARTKTDAYIALDKEWHIQGRELEIGSTWGSWGVSFHSWRK